MKQASRALRSIAALIFIVSTCLQGIQPAAAQEGDGERIGHNRNTGKVSFVGAPTGHPIRVASAQAPNMAPRDRALAMLQPYGADFGLANAGRDLSVKAALSERGRDVTRFQQTHRGIPVMGGEIVVNADDRGGLLSINGEISPDLDLDVTPRVTAELAQLAAIQAMAKVHGGAPSDYSASEPELWIYDSRLLEPDGTQPGLVWRMNVGATDAGVPINELVLIDANRGNVRLNFNQIDTSWSGTGGSKPPQLSAAETRPLDGLRETAADARPPRTQPPSLHGTGLDRYVSTTGTDTGACTNSATPCLTIKYAVQQATAGNVIKVGVGTYTGAYDQVVAIDRSLHLIGGWDSTFSNQSGWSTIDGGGARKAVRVAQWQTVTLENFVFRNATATGLGASVESSGDLRIINSVVTSNLGKGIYVLGSGTLLLENSTVTGNADTGVYLWTTGSIQIRNSILARNGPTQISDCSGTINTSDHNIVGSTWACTVSAGVGDQLNVDPLLGAYPIGDYGYYTLLEASPAIGAGDNATCPPIDVRGMSRPQGATCDIGAYEFVDSPGVPHSLGAASGSGQHAALNTPFSRPLAVYVVDGLGSAVPDVDVTFHAPTSGPSVVFPGNVSETVATTDSAGLAIVDQFAANAELGGFTVDATVDGIGETASFELMNAEWYVTTAGSDTNSCDAPASPCLTITAAIGKALEGDTIKVAAGIYTGSPSYDEVVTLYKDVTILGGWNAAFTDQSGFSTIDGEHARAGIHSYTGSISRFIIKNGLAYPSNGGGIWHSGNTLTVTDSLITQNTGGGIYATGSLVLNNSAVIGNSTDGWGGGIHFTGVEPSLTIRNSTIAFNHAGDYHTGGGIYLGGGAAPYEPGATVIENSAVVFNSAGWRGGGIHQEAGGSPPRTDIVRNTLLFGNSAPFGPDCWGTLDISSHNIYGSIADCTRTSSAADQMWVDPLLSNYAIGAPPYFVLKAGSPAIDAGDACLSTDQRGVVRPQGFACDIGPYEYSASAGPAVVVGVAAGDGQTASPSTTFGDPLVAYTLDADGTPVSGVAISFTAPVSGPSGIFADTSSTITTAVTDAAGFAMASDFSANSELGPYAVELAAAGVSQNAQLLLANATPNLWTYTAGNTASLPGTLLCNQSQPACTGGANPHADKAHLYAQQTVDLYSTHFRRNGIDNHSMPVVSTVHYSSGYDNAFWNGAQMVYGDDGSWPFADDVVGHELTHGVTQYESGLFYFYQSGAINESLSDVFGELFDQTNPGGTDTPAVKWLIGEDVTGGSDPGPFRSMGNPPAYGGMPSFPPYENLPTAGDPDRINSSNYYIGAYDNGGVHTNSGVNNKAAFLMVDGGTFNSKTVTALGSTKALAIYYEAQVDLLTSGSDYGDLYYILPQACLNLVGGADGVTSADCLEVQDAVDAVAMNAQPSSDTGFNTEAPLCSAGNRPSDVFYDTLEFGTGNWNLGTARWQLDGPYDPRAHSSLHFLYADDMPDDIADVSAAMTTGVLLPANAFLHFAHAYDFEYYLDDPNWYDGGVLEYSLNDGAWTDAGSLFTHNGYDHTIFTYPSGYESYSNPLHGRSAFTGTSHGYISSRSNLASLSGNTVKFRWRMGLDYAGANWGWWLDDVRIYTCVPAGTVAISGNTGAPGVTLNYLDAGPKSVISDDSGNYSFTVPGGWSGSVSVSKAHYTFAPPNRTYTNLITASPNQDYAATIETHTLTYAAGANGSISGASLQTVGYGSNGTPVTAVPDPGYHFLKWSDNSEANPRTDLNVTVDKSLTASFVINSGARTDFDGDNRTDPAKFVAATGKTWWIRSSDGVWASANLGTDTTSYVPRSDFNGDGKADPAKFLSSGALYYIESSTGTWGGLYVGSDYNTAASGSDFDGDGRTDPAKYLPEGAVWYYKSSTASWQGEFIGPDAVPYLPASDYDGDGKTDMAKYISIGAIWYLKSSTGTWDGAYIGSDGTPIAGSDFDGDGKTDVAKFLSGSNSVWYQKSSTGTWEGVYMGPGAFQYITASDFDGDGKTDPAKFDAAGKVLWWIKSTTGQWDGAWLGAEDFQTVN